MDGLPYNISVSSLVSTIEMPHQTLFHTAKEVREVFMLRRRYGILIFAVMLICCSFGLRWYSTGGGKEVLDSSDPRVAAALEFAKEEPGSRYTASYGTFMKAWQSGKPAPGEEFKINIGLEYNNHLWLVSVVFDANGQAIGSTSKGWAGISISNFLRIMGTVLSLVWFGWAFIVPLFGVKCPDCSTNPLLPVVTDIKDRTVFAGGLDVEGYSLSPIVERSYVCPKCGYTKVRYVLPYSYRPAAVRDIMDLRPSGWDLWKRFPMERMLDRRREERANLATFKTFDEWKAFYEQLKLKEGEERRGR